MKMALLSMSGISQEKKSLGANSRAARRLAAFLTEKMRSDGQSAVSL
jgi:hypothetical protein